MRDVNTPYFFNFSPDGSLAQTEFSIDSTKMGATILGLKNKAGIFLFVEKSFDSKLIENQEYSKIETLNKNFYCAISGLTSDARFLFEKTLIYIQNNFFIFNTFPSLENCAKKIRDFISFSFFEKRKEFVTSRPFGIGFILMGRDSSGLNLFLVDPTGEYYDEKICALGEGCRESNFYMKEAYRKKMSYGDSKEFVMKIFNSVLSRGKKQSKIEIVFLKEKKSTVFRDFFDGSSKKNT